VNLFHLSHRKRLNDVNKKKEKQSTEKVHTLILHGTYSIIFLDLLFALSTLGFDPYVEPLKLYLTKYRESVKGDKIDAELGEEGLHISQSSQGQIVQLQEHTGAQHVIIQDIPDQNGQFIFKQE